MENPSNPYQGKIWVPYINNKKEDWDLIVENNLQYPLQGTKIVWKFENFPNTLQFTKSPSTGL